MPESVKYLVCAIPWFVYESLGESGRFDVNIYWYLYPSMSLKGMHDIDVNKYMAFRIRIKMHMLRAPLTKENFNAFTFSFFPFLCYRKQVSIMNISILYKCIIYVQQHNYIYTHSVVVVHCSFHIKSMNILLWHWIQLTGIQSEPTCMILFSVLLILLHISKCVCAKFMRLFSFWMACVFMSHWWLPIEEGENKRHDEKTIQRKIPACEQLIAQQKLRKIKT